MIRTSLNAFKALRTPRCRPRHRLVLACLPLESRTLLSTVTSLLDDGGAGTLRSVVAAAPAGDIITFAHSLRGTLTLNQGPITIARSLEIDGPGAGKLAISGGGTSGLFSIQSGNFAPSAPAVVVTIGGLALRDGHVAAGTFGGGVITASQADLTLQDVAVVNNDASQGYQGGVITTIPNYDFTQYPYQEGPSTLTILDSTFTGNTGDAVYASDTMTNIDGALFQNTAGSAVVADTSGFLTPRLLTVSDSAFVGNVVSGSFFAGGAAILNYAAAVVQDCRFEANRVVGSYYAQGGAILNSAFVGGPLTVTGSTFVNNTAEQTGPYYGVAEGGAIATPSGFGSGNVTVDHCRFDGNRAEAAGGGLASGGAIYNGGQSFFPPFQGLSVSNSQFTNNIALGASFAAGASGGAVANTGGFLNLSHVLFSGNCAQGRTDPSGLGGTASGGAVENDNCVLTLNDGTFLNNTARSGAATVGYFSSNARGGAVSLVGTFSVSGAESNIQDSLFAGNAAIGGSGLGTGAAGSTVYGGAVALFYDGAVNFARTTFVANQALGGSAGAGGIGGTAYGGGLGIYGSSATVSDSCFAANRAKGGDSPGGTGGDGDGGAISATLFPFTYTSDGVSTTFTGSLALARVAIAGNSARGGAGSTAGNAQGGGLSFDGPYGGIATLTDVLATGNTAQAGPAGQGLGGGLFITAGSTVQINKKSKIVGNSASTAGNDVYGPYSLV